MARHKRLLKRKEKKDMLEVSKPQEEEILASDIEKDQEYLLIMTQCINCNIAIRATQQFQYEATSMSPELISILEEWITQEVTAKDFICPECVNLLVTELGNRNEGRIGDRQLGHQSVCVCCGISVLRQTGRRSHPLVDGHPVRNYIVTIIKPHQLPAHPVACSACWQRAQSNIQQVKPLRDVQVRTHSQSGSSSIIDPPKEDLVNYNKCKLMNDVPRLKRSATLRNIAQDTKKVHSPEKSETPSQLTKSRLLQPKSSKAVKRKCEKSIVPSKPKAMKPSTRTPSCSTLPLKTLPRSVDKTHHRIKKKIENLSICRICLTTKNDLGIKELLDKSLQKMYTELTNKPFITEDKRSTLVCYMCLARLRNCHKLRVQCLRSERFFTQLLNGDASLNKEDVSPTNGMETTPMFLLATGGQTKEPPDCEVKSEPEEIDFIEDDSEKCNLYETDDACPPQEEFYPEVNVTTAVPDENITIETDYACLPQEEFYPEVDVTTADENITIELEEIKQVPKRENIDGSTSEDESTDTKPEKGNWITQKLKFIDNESDCEENNDYNELKTAHISEEFGNQSIFVDDEPIYDARRHNDPLKTEQIYKEIDKMELSVDIEHDCDEKNVYAPQKNLSQNSEELGNTSVSYSYEEKVKVVYSCEQCSKCFSTLSDLQKHILRMHREKKCL